MHMLYTVILCISGDLTAGLLHSLRTRREEEEVNPIPKRSDSLKVGSRISNKFKNLYSTDDEDTGMFYQPPRKSKSHDQKYVASNSCSENQILAQHRDRRRISLR